MIYKSQSSLRIRLTTSADITDASSVKIKYIKPSGVTGSWTATVEHITQGIIYYDLQTGDLDESGNWVFWAYVTFSDSRSAPGEAVKIKVHEEGS